MNKLPKQYEEDRLLKYMKPGDTGYIVPWGMWVDMAGNCWLNEDYTFHENTGGTVQLKVTRVECGYIAHIHEMKENYKWQKQDRPGYMSKQEVCYGRVVGFNISAIESAFSAVKKTRNTFVDLFKQVWN